MTAQDGSAQSAAASEPSSAADGADSILRDALDNFEMRTFECRHFEWTGDIATAVYKYGAAAVETLRKYRDEGSLRGDALVDALDHLGRIRDLSSQPQRRALLVEALSAPDAEIRYAAATGLIFLRDSAALEDLHEALAVEDRDLVKVLMGAAIDASQPPA